LQRQPSSADALFGNRAVEAITQQLAAAQQYTTKKMTGNVIKL